MKHIVKYTSAMPMLDPARLALFLTATFILLLTPGPAVTYIVSRTLAEGRRAGLVSALGIAGGGLVHVAAAALGLSALLASSAVAFSIVKYAGAAYLIVLGLRTLLTPTTAADETLDVPGSLSRAFWQGVIVNVLNPKTALFFVAFLPQFVDPARGSVVVQMAALGFLFTALALGTDSMFVLAAGSAGTWLKRNRGFLRARRYVAGSVYLGLGVATALAGPTKK
jgi:threonine/homoserine/homoserine lactone efflux protein